MDTPLCSAGLVFDIAQSANVPYRPIQDDRTHHDESGQEKFLAKAEEETCVDANSAIEKSVETANKALSLYGCKGPLHENSELENLYVRPKCYAPKLAPFEPGDRVS